MKNKKLLIGLSVITVIIILVIVSMYRSSTTTTNTSTDSQKGIGETIADFFGGLFKFKKEDDSEDDTSC